MKPDDLDRKLERLRDASGRIAANLVELEIDSSRQLLEASNLVGKSAVRWSAASAALTELWQWNGLLEALLERAAGARGPRRADELRALLEGPSIELSTSEVPIVDRDLLGSPESTVRCSPDQLLVRMSTAFDAVKSAMSQIGAAWEVLIPRLEQARRVLVESTALAAEVGEPGRRDLDEAAHRVADLGAALSGDPLSVTPATVDALTRSLEAIHADLAASAELGRELDARVSGARALLDELQATIAAGHDAHEEVTVKISVPATPAALHPRDDLALELTELVTVARGGGWREARRMLEKWTAETTATLAEARRILAANRAPIQARKDFRALLDAYQVKAKRLGLVENELVESIFAEAHEALYNAPTDLALVGRLIRRYQEALGGSPSTPEALR